MVHGSWFMVHGLLLDSYESSTMNDEPLGQVSRFKLGAK